MESPWKTMENPWKNMENPWCSLENGLKKRKLVNN
jgi:hypothetical protein